MASINNLKSVCPTCVKSRRLSRNNAPRDRYMHAQKQCEKVYLYLYPPLAFSILRPLLCKVLSSVERKSRQNANLLGRCLSMLVSLKYKSLATLSASMLRFDISANIYLVPLLVLPHALVIQLIRHTFYRHCNFFDFGIVKILSASFVRVFKPH